MTSATDTPLISTHRLTYSWPDRPLWTDLDLAIPAGLTVLTGDEGCGKTTLLRLLAGELEPQKGEIRLKGRSATPRTLLTVVAWTDPRTDVHDGSIVSDYLAAQRVRFAQMDTQLLNDLLDAFMLGGHLHKTFHMLSTGSRRKVWLAAALASMAPVVLLDQPYAALDAPATRLVSRLLQESARSMARAFIVADHEAPAFVIPEQVISLGC